MKFAPTITFLLSALFSNFAYADYARIWRGQKLPHLTDDKFIYELNFALFPSTGALAKKSAKLQMYVPAVINHTSAQFQLPDEVALLVYESEENYRNYRSTAEGIQYGDLHWQIFDREKSGSVVPSNQQEITSLGQAVAPVPIANGVKPNGGTLRIIQRPADTSDDKYIARVNQHIQNTLLVAPAGYYVIVDQQYTLEYLFNKADHPQLPSDIEQSNELFGQVLFESSIVPDHQIETFGAIIYPVGKSTEEENVRSVWEHHIDAWGKRDLDRIMVDYSESSVVVQNDRVFRGTQAIRELFQSLFRQFDLATEAKIDRVTVENNVVYITWAANYPDPSQNEVGTDTFVISSGIITTQTIAAFKTAR